MIRRGIVALLVLWPMLLAPPALSMAGTYLGACMFFAALYEQSRIGLDYAAGLDADVAAYLQTVAWQTLTDYEQRSKS